MISLLIKYKWKLISYDKQYINKHKIFIKKKDKGILKLNKISKINARKRFKQIDQDNIEIENYRQINGNYKNWESSLIYIKNHQNKSILNLFF